MKYIQFFYTWTIILILIIFFFQFSDAQFDQFVRYFYYKPAKHFPHFDYIYKLTQKCKLRIEKMRESKSRSKSSSKDVVIEVGIAGWFNENNLELISKIKGNFFFIKVAHN